ncbi:MAG: GNAT family N-acetyltransferase [Bacteroidota bacterium]
MVRLARFSEIGDILKITRACAEHMAKKGIHQWNEHYPSRKAFKNDIARKELYVKVIGEKIKGGIVISTFMDVEYAAVKWLTPNQKNIYVHRLFIHPEQQGKGHAQELMGLAENHARTNGFDSVRLDTFSQNKRNQRFYQTRGYQRLGDIFFPQQSEHPFHCYELVL